MRLLICLLVFTIVFPATARAERVVDRPNILWIVAEDISPFFGCYGSPDAITPNIDAFAQRSHLFRRAYATAPICSPSRSCLATGMYATSLGSQHLRCKVRLPKEISPLAKIFKDNGYWTALRGKTDYNFADDGLFDDWSGKKAAGPWKKCPDGKPFFTFWNLGSTHEGSGNRPERAADALKKLPHDAVRDPANVTVPPHHPDSPEMRRIWARYHELITVFDLEVGKALEQLEADGLADDTIVFLMADHGMGLPRYKRWLYLTGLHVPLIVHLPERFQGKQGQTSVRDALVSYVDLPATALHLAGIDVPDYFAGQDIFSEQQRSYVFGARDRADDMYDLSRCVFDGRYLYIRHYLPHLPPMQEGYILSPVYKESLIELHRLHDAGLDTEHSRKMWQPRPFEELYDIQNDPHEMQNLADSSTLNSVKKRLEKELKSWILKTRDSGFLTESEMHRRAIEANVAQHTILHDDATYPIARIFAAADQASRPDAGLLSGGDDPLLDFWAIQQRIIRGLLTAPAGRPGGSVLTAPAGRPGGSVLTAPAGRPGGSVLPAATGRPGGAVNSSEESRRYFRSKLESENPTVRATAAEALARLGEKEPAIPVFRQLLSLKEPNLRLYVARSLALSFDNIKPLEKEVRAARQDMLAPPGSPRPWKDFVYSAFTSWALEWALVKSGLNEWSDFQGL